MAAPRPDVIAAESPVMDTDPFEFAEDVCRHCGAHVGYGARFLHLNCCDDCRGHDTEES